MTSSAYLVAAEVVDWWRDVRKASAREAMAAIGRPFDMANQGWDDVIAAYAEAWLALRNNMGQPAPVAEPRIDPLPWAAAAPMPRVKPRGAERKRVA